MSPLDWLNPHETSFNQETLRPLPAGAASPHLPWQVPPTSAPTLPSQNLLSAAGKRKESQIPRADVVTLQHPIPIASPSLPFLSIPPGVVSSSNSNINFLRVPIFTTNCPNVEPFTLTLMENLWKSVIFLSSRSCFTSSWPLDFTFSSATSALSKAFRLVSSAWRSAFLASPRSSFKSLFSARSPAMSRHMSSTGRSCSAEVRLRSISLLPQRDLFNGFYKWGTSNHPMLLIFSIIHLGAHVWKPPLVGEILWNPGPPSGPPSARLCLLHPQCGKFSLQLLCITCRSCGCGNFLELLL